MPSLVAPRAPKAATKAPSWRRSTTTSGSDSSRWESNLGSRWASSIRQKAWSYTDRPARARCSARSARRPACHSSTPFSAWGPSLRSASCLPPSVPNTAPTAASMGSPLRSALASAWRISTSLAISATVWSSRMVPSFLGAAGRSSVGLRPELLLRADVRGLGRSRVRALDVVGVGFDDPRGEPVGRQRHGRVLLCHVLADQDAQGALILGLQAATAPAKHCSHVHELLLSPSPGDGPKGAARVHQKAQDCNPELQTARPTDGEGTCVHRQVVSALSTGVRGRLEFSEVPRSSPSW